MKLTLFLMLGYPGSGKTTFAKKLAEARGVVRVNSDELRRDMYKNPEAIYDPQNMQAVYGALDYATKLLLSAGTSVVYDANNSRLDDRNAAYRLAAEYGAASVIVWLKTPLEVAKKRESERKLLDGYRRISTERYEEMVGRLQVPNPEETVISIDGLQAFDDQLASFKRQLVTLES